MKILLTNDDGVVSTGIQVLARTLTDMDLLGGVLAPDRERSGTGHAITVGFPLRVFPLDPGMFSPTVSAYSCDGTPTDCVNLGLDLLFPHTDLVVSGINQGPNLGEDVTYSGTVCAAMEGAVLGRPAMAVSLCCSSSHDIRHNTTAALATMALLKVLEDAPLPEGTFLNVNVPNVLVPGIKGFKLTRLGKRRYHDKFTKMKDPTGRDCYWIGGKTEDSPVEGTDIAAIAEGYISVTPLHVDMTDHGFLGELKDAGFVDKLLDVVHSAHEKASQGESIF